MFVTLSPYKSSGNLSLLDLMKSFKVLGSEVETKMMNSLVYEQDFVIYWMKVLDKLHPNLCLIGNSFLQQPTLEYLINKGIIQLYICSDSSEPVEKYKTGQMYQSLYNQLKKTCKGVYLNEEPDGYLIDDILTTNDLLKITLITWREMHMGEITDAITKALSSVDSDVNQDEVKQAMANLGMPVKGYTQQSTTPVPEPKKTQEKKPTKPIMNPPEPQEESDEGDEMCCKISGNTLVLMFPKDTQFNTVTVGDVEFNTLAVSIPDVNSRKLQVLSIIRESSSESEESADENSSTPDAIVRVPIFLNEKKEKPAPAKKPQTVTESGDLADLRQQKEKLDAAIKQARSTGDTGLVEQLRKQRRKVRAEINKLGGGE